MYNLLNRCFRSTRAAAAVEFALLVPIILLTTAVIVELGRGLAQAQAVEKGLRGGVMVAARSSWPMDTEQEDTVIRMVITGTVKKCGVDPGFCSYLVDGWDDPGSVTITPKTCPAGTDTGECIEATNYYEITATVPYVELLPGIAGMFGLADVTVKTVHAQVYIGN